MLRHFVHTLITVAFLSLSASCGNAIEVGSRASVDWGGHQTRGEHVNYCINQKRNCLSDIGPGSPRRPDAASHCTINYSQCMNM